MISTISNSTQIFNDQISSGTMAFPLTSLVKKALAIITINGLISSKMYAAAIGLSDIVRCSIQCLPYVLDLSIYAQCIARCMAGG